MYARVASFERLDPSLVDELIGRLRERAPEWQRELPTASGQLGLLDREGRRSVGITFFENEDAIRDAEPVFERMGEELPEEMRGRRASVEVYEVAVHEAEEGVAAARVSTLEGPPERIDEALYHARENIFPRAKQLSGWTGVVALVDRESGRMRLITLWESADALRATEEQADRLRQEAAEAGGQRIVSVDSYEISVAELPQVRV